MANVRQLRVGAVSYLNTRPLVYRLGEFAPEIELIYDLPSRLADDLAAGRLDVALIPSIEYLLQPDYTIVSDACIACRGPVMSVKLLSRVPIAQIRRLALDEGSRTSVALTRILLHRRFGLTPKLETLPIDADPTETQSDAVLLIGDRAIHPPTDGFVETWDLGDRWCRWSELPFVFAMWTAGPGVDPIDLIPALEAARDAGCQHLEQIAEQEKDKVNLSADECLAYLRDNLHFHLGPREQCGLRLFFEQAVALQLAPHYQHREILRFHDCKAS